MRIEDRRTTGATRGSVVGGGMGEADKPEERGGGGVPRGNDEPELGGLWMGWGKRKVSRE